MNPSLRYLWRQTWESRVYSCNDDTTWKVNAGWINFGIVRLIRKEWMVGRQRCITSAMTTVLRDYRLRCNRRLFWFARWRLANVYTRGDWDGTSVRFTMLRGKRCYHNDCNIMTPRYGKIVFISDLRLYTGKRARTISPTIVCAVHTDDRD